MWMSPQKILFLLGRASSAASPRLCPFLSLSLSMLRKRQECHTGYSDVSFTCFGEHWWTKRKRPTESCALFTENTPAGEHSHHACSNFLLRSTTSHFSYTCSQPSSNVRFGSPPRHLALAWVPQEVILYLPVWLRLEKMWSATIIREI